MGCQALSGIAKDLTKMSAKSAVKVLVPEGRRIGLVQVGRGADRLEERAEGRRLFRRRLSALGARVSRRAARDGGRRAASSWCRAELSCPPRSVRRRRSRRSRASCRIRRASTGCRWRGWRCSPRATSGSSSACRSSWRACSAGRSRRSAGSWRCGSSPTAACRASRRVLLAQGDARQGAAARCWRQRSASAWRPSPR